jgi:hypothetical protein
MFRHSASLMPDLLLSWKTLEPLGIVSTRIGNAFHGDLLKHAKKIEHLSGAVIYHCTNLAGLYTQHAARMDHERERLGVTNSSRVISGNGAELYYEFEVLMTRIRRLYDAPSGLIRLLWATRPN